MRALWMLRVVVVSGVVCVVSSFCGADGPNEKSTGQLQREVAERQRQLMRAQRALAEAQARLALVEGKRAVAIGELRKAVDCCQGEVQWIRDHANWFCDPREPMDEARWDLAKVRVWLAETEGDTATLVAEWKKIVGFHEQRRDRVRRLVQMRAVKPEEERVVQEALAQARQRLEAAEKQLATERARKHDPSKK